MLRTKHRVVIFIGAQDTTNIPSPRLKTRLNLQKAPPRPPCGPRIYKKLYQYLDTTLSASADTTTPTATPTKQRTRDVFATPTKLGGGNGNGTPSKATAITPSRPLTGGLNFATIGKQPVLVKDTGATMNDEGVPGWISTTIRHICKNLEISAAIPHIYVGVATLLKSSSTASTTVSPTKAQARTPKTGRGVLDAAVSSRVATETENTVKIPALIIVVMLLVVKRMYPGNDNVNVRSVSHELVALGRVTSKRLREVMMECERLEEDEKEMERWEGMEWFGNVPVGEEGGDVEMVDVRDELDHGEGDRIVVKRSVASISTPSATPSVKPVQVQVQPAAPTPATKQQPPPPPPPTTAGPASKSLQQAQQPQRTPRPKSSTPCNADDIRPTGLGALDWLSPARRAEHEKWKATMFRRLSEKEGRQSSVDTRTNRATAGRKRKADVLSSPVV